ncbi:MAG TPA: hypothetical protein VHP38_05660 [Ruminiclostridium sp.]|nr:hypothetical protein [Ruminiclostridium sp.]
MLLLIMIIVDTIIFVACKLKGLHAVPQDKTRKITIKLKRFLLIAPILALAVFAILFSTVLPGRFYERSSHALLLLMLWLYATSCYLEIMQFYKNKKLVALNGVGIALSIALVTILSPLYRFNVIIYNSLLFP